MILFALLLWLVLEIASAFAVAHLIGVLPCVLLLIAGWPAGAALMRAQGRATVARLREVLAGGRPPAGARPGDALALLAGPLLIIPGFVTDVLAALLLVPVVRRRVWVLAAGRIRGRVWPRAGRGGRRYDVDATAHETTRPASALDRPQLHG